MTMRRTRGRMRSAKGIVAACIMLASILSAFFSVPASVSAAVPVILACASFDRDAREDCYRATLPEIMQTRGLADTFGVVRTLQSFDPAMRDCHFVAHRIGERAIAEDRSRWDELLREASDVNLCAYGFVHGVTIAAFRDGVTDDDMIGLIPEFARACDITGENRRAACIHALGHMLYYAAGSDIRRALHYCDLVFIRDPNGGAMTDDRRCYTAAMMMTFFPFIDPDSEDVLLPEITTETSRSFCAALGDPAHVGACLRARWPLFRDLILREGGLDEFCADQPDDAETEWCYAKVAVAVGWIHSTQPGDAARLCNAVLPARRTLCFVHVAHEIVSGRIVDGVSLAVDVCDAAVQHEVRADCMEALAISAGRFAHHDHSERERFCGSIPEGYRQMCLSASDR